MFFTIGGLYEVNYYIIYYEDVLLNTYIVLGAILKRQLIIINFPLLLNCMPYLFKFFLIRGVITEFIILIADHNER